MAKDIFKENKSLDVAYKTSDGVHFYTKNNAENHAKTLKNKRVEKVTRPEDEKQLSEDDKIAKITKMTTVEEIEAFVKEEQSEKVLDFAMKKAENLKQA